MGFFSKSPAVSHEMTTEAYQLWLRAGRPQPIAWFAALDEENQTALAALGDEYVQDVVVGIGYAVRNPRAADAGLDAVDNIESEKVLVSEIAADMARNLLSEGFGQPPQPNSTGHTMAGMGDRIRKDAEANGAPEEVSG